MSVYKNPWGCALLSNPVLGESSVVSSPTASSSHIPKGSAGSLPVPVGPQLLFLLGRDLQENAAEPFTGE